MFTSWSSWQKRAMLFQHLPSLHCTVIGFTLDWESHKSLKHESECLTELLERACFYCDTEFIHIVTPRHNIFNHTRFSESN